MKTQEEKLNEIKYDCEMFQEIIIEKLDIFIENGIISKISDKIKPLADYKVIEGKNIHVSAGWFDLRANFCEPGHEYKEDIQSGLKAAAYGGFTGVAVSSATHPPIDNRASVEFLLSTQNEIRSRLRKGSNCVFLNAFN